MEREAGQLSCHAFPWTGKQCSRAVQEKGAQRGEMKSSKGGDTEQQSSREQSRAACSKGNQGTGDRTEVHRSGPEVDPVQNWAEAS